MKRWLSLSLATAILATAAAAGAQTPKQGGIMRAWQRDSPGSASIHEEATYSTNFPFMGVFSNLVIYKQDVAQNSMDSIVPELAASWQWSADNKDLTFKTRPGVKWHDGKPFTANDVKCTFDKVRDLTQDKFRKNPRKAWFSTVRDITVQGDDEVTFHLERPQPALLALLASGYAPIYPCHTSAQVQRTAPIGTGPFKFVSFKQNESITLARNPDYWKPGRPYLDGIEYTIVTNRSTAVLGFIAGKFDMTFPLEITPPILRDIKAQAPGAQCFTAPLNVSTNLIVNRDKPPFDNADVRRAMALTMDRKAFVDILSEGEADIGGTMLPGPEGVWGMSKEMLATMTGYGPDIAANRAQARKIMADLGYGPNKMLKVKISTRNIATYRDPAVILIDHLKEIFIEGELDVVETSVWFAKLARKDYAVGLNLTGNAVDDPDQAFYENYSCGSERNVTGYCNKELEKAFDAQSQETDPAKRKAMVWEIDRKLQNDVARPIILHDRKATCTGPALKGYTQMVNSVYNGYRFDELWLNR